MPDLDSYTDIELLLRLQKGEEEAFDILYRKYAESLIEYAASRLHSLDEARDLIHDLFVYIWQERNNISVQISLRAFLFTAIKYRIIDHYRKNLTQRKYRDEIAKISEISIGAEDLMHAKEMEKNIQIAINELSPRVQEVFRLSRFHYLSISEIAKKLGISEQTVKNQLSTALSHLRSKFLDIYLLILWLAEDLF